MFKGAFSAFPRRLGEECAHQRPQRPAPAVRALVISALALTDGQRQGDFLLALLVVGHDRSSLMPPGQCPSAVTIEAFRGEIYSLPAVEAREVHPHPVAIAPRTGRAASAGRGLPRKGGSSLQAPAGLCDARDAAPLRRGGE